MLSFNTISHLSLIQPSNAISFPLLFRPSSKLSSLGLLVLGAVWEAEILFAAAQQQLPPLSQPWEGHPSTQRHLATGTKLWLSAC